MTKHIKRVADTAGTYAALENMRENMDMKKLAKEILLEENYIKFMKSYICDYKSYRFTFWFQLIGILAGFILPSLVFLLTFKEIEYCAFGLAIGIMWICIWLPISLMIPQTRIYRKFAKWYRSSHATINELDVIFYADR